MTAATCDRILKLLGGRKLYQAGVGQAAIEKV
jgi:hypothetical protein